jgi:hypothetical protein
MGNLQVNENKEWGCRTQSFERAVENARRGFVRESRKSQMPLCPDLAGVDSTSTRGTRPASLARVEVNSERPLLLSSMDLLS